MGELTKEELQAARAEALAQRQAQGLQGVEASIAERLSALAGEVAEQERRRCV